MKRAMMFALLTLVAEAMLADGDYLETMRRPERLMMNAPRYARVQNPTLRGWALGQIELTAEEIHHLRAEREAKARGNRAELANEAREKRQQTGGALAPGVGQPFGRVIAPAFGSYSGGGGFPGASARGPILGPGRCSYRAR